MHVCSGVICVDDIKQCIAVCIYAWTSCRYGYKIHRAGCRVQGAGCRGQEAGGRVRYRVQGVYFKLIVIIIVLLEITDHDHDPPAAGESETEMLPSALSALSTLIMTTHDQDHDQYANDRDRSHSAGSHFAIVAIFSDIAIAILRVHI